VDALSESLATRVAKRLGLSSGGDGGGGDGDGGGYGRPPQMVPYDRLQRALDANKALKGDLVDLQASLGTLSDGYKATLGRVREETAANLRGIGQRHQEDIALIDAGLTDSSGRRALRNEWDDLPKDSRGKTPADWWQGQLDAHKAHAADPELAQPPKLPRTLAGYLPQVDAGGKGTGGKIETRNPRSSTKREQTTLDSLPDDDLGEYLAGLRKMG
jgi:hypothetical protein